MRSVIFLLPLPVLLFSSSSLEEASSNIFCLSARKSEEEDDDDDDDKALLLLLLSNISKGDEDGNTGTGSGLTISSSSLEDESLIDS